MNRLKPLANATMVLAALNFISFVIVASLLGGDALNGHVTNGHYFLDSHGRLTEVSAQVFNYSAWHARSIFVTHALAFLTGGLAYGVRGARGPNAATSPLVEDDRGRR